MRDSFIFHRNFVEAIEDLPADDFKQAVSAIIEYTLYGREPDVSGVAKMFFIMAKPTLDRDIRLMDGQNGRNCKEYQDWRKAVFTRDNYTCQMCGAKEKQLNAHHRKRYSLYPGLRYEVNNGITLCEDCHREVHRRERKER